MTGVVAGERPGLCALCGGSLAESKADVPFRTGSGVLLLKGIPAWVCGDCGEPYLHGPILDRVVQIVRDLDALGSEVSVVSFRAA
jgi:YgiT-type zinc finger domain-containing protein